MNQKKINNLKPYPKKTRGTFFLLSSPSGAGKTSLIQALLQKDDQLIPSVSLTTRPPRPGEIDGQHYLFCTPKEFESQLKEGSILEHAEVFGHWYGTPHTPIQNHIKEGRDVICDVDWQGARSIRKIYQGALKTIFILPPNLDTLRKRLENRGQDSLQVIQNRLDGALKDISYWHEYDHILINDDFEKSLDDLKNIVRQARAEQAQKIECARWVEENFYDDSGQDHEPL